MRQWFTGGAIGALEGEIAMPLVGLTSYDNLLVIFVLSSQWCQGRWWMKCEYHTSTSKVVSDWSGVEFEVCSTWTWHPGLGPSVQGSTRDRYVHTEFHSLHFTVDPSVWMCMSGISTTTIASVIYIRILITILWNVCQMTAFDVCLELWEKNVSIGLAIGRPLSPDRPTATYRNKYKTEFIIITRWLPLFVAFTLLLYVFRFQIHNKNNSDDFFFSSPWLIKLKTDNNIEIYQEVPEFRFNCFLTVVFRHVLRRSEYVSPQHISYDTTVNCAH